MIKINENSNIYFPIYHKARSQQIEMLNFVKNSINSGKKFLLINAPTGSGKSMLAFMIANWYKSYVNSDAKFDIITNSKILQQQYKDEFDYVNNLKGQSNYQCEPNNTDCKTGKEFNKTVKKIPCANCPYDNAKDNWIRGDISLTNFHLYNSFAFYVPDTLNQRNGNVLIIDEAHSYEEVFCDFISIKLSARVLKNYGIEDRDIDLYKKKFSNIKTAGSFVNFISNDFIPFLLDLKQYFEDNFNEVTNKKVKKTYIEFIDNIQNAIERYNTFLKDFDSHEYNWALDIIKNKTGDIELIMQPIWGHVYLDDLIWSRYDHVIFMSGSILDKNIFSYLNGFDESLTSYIDFESTFPVKNRPLYFFKAGKMTYDQKQTTFNNQLPIIEKILKKYKNDRGIIHTTNYEISKWIQDSIKNDRLLYHTTEDREEQLNVMKKNQNGVIVSPSMTSGISLDNDLGRFQIILKVPFPNISSNKIKARQNANRQWYIWRSIVDIIQAYGRTTRSEDDYSDSYILDSSFGDLLKTHSYMMPRYFLEAIKILK